ncbi:aspartate kinase [Alkalimarinus coralli]|uniref:aspartate kinase n=1 Tax=Alkalimarinus coralli TaxID=2935863 RepID=UPI00202B82A5|nr:aspartate kinase [Alkalimarinus coralli]
MHLHTVEKIGGTSMNDYEAVRDNIILNPSQKENIYNRVLVVSAYSGITDLLLEHKKTGHPGVFSLFSNSINDNNWREMLEKTKQKMFDTNKALFQSEQQLSDANEFISERIDDAESCLSHLQRLCKHGHFSLETHLDSVREMLACIGEAHSARNTAQLLNLDGINACFIDLTGWRSMDQVSLDERIEKAFSNIDLSSAIPVVTGYAHSEEGLMTHFDRGYSEMTFSRIAVLTQASEAIIHKEFHLSSADPRLVGENNAVPIGRTNYDVADQLANLGMEAIHPKAAKGLRQNKIPLRVRNTFEPDHYGTLITQDYVSDSPCVEIIAGQKGVWAVELFDQDMTGKVTEYDHTIVDTLKKLNLTFTAKDVNANTITHYINTDSSTLKRLVSQLKKSYPDAEINQQKVAIVSAIGSDMQVPGILSRTVNALSEQGISILAIHQSMRQVDMQFIIDERNYDTAVKSLHRCLVEVHDHGRAICLAS